MCDKFWVLVVQTSLRSRNNLTDWAKPQWARPGTFSIQALLPALGLVTGFNDFLETLQKNFLKRHNLQMYLLFSENGNMWCVDSQSVWPQIGLAATDAYKFALHDGINEWDMFESMSSKQWINGEEESKLEWNKYNNNNNNDHICQISWTISSLKLNQNHQKLNK